jgi:hypothetical protein
MKLVRAKKVEEVVFGKGFVPILTAIFAGTVEEIESFCRLRESGKCLHIIIQPTGSATFKGEELHSSE